MTTTATHNRTTASAVLSLRNVSQARKVFSDLCVFCADGHENEKDAVAQSLFDAEKRPVKGSRSRVTMPVDEHDELMELIDHLASVSVARESHVDVQVTSLWNKLASLVSTSTKKGS